MVIKIQLLNKIDPQAFDQLDPNLYKIGENVVEPDAIIVRSADMHQMTIPSSVKIVGRAGAGVNNIPVNTLTKRGIPVLNTPGANANSVKELVIAGMLLASRHIPQALEYLQHLNVDDNELTNEVEKNKKNFSGFELWNKKLGVVGLGNVGVKVANAGLALGMQVIGYDPGLSIDKAWELSSSVEKAHNMKELLSEADFISFHIPTTADTERMINHDYFRVMKDNVILLNFSRHEIIDVEALLAALNAQKIRSYVSDFPHPLLLKHPKIIFLPHIGASTVEAEKNCGTMLVKNIKDYFENGSLLDAINFPRMIPSKKTDKIRLSIVNTNMPNMVAQITSVLAKHKLNITYLLNSSRNDIAYNIIDVDSSINHSLLDEIAAIQGVIQVREV